MTNAAETAAHFCYENCRVFSFSLLLLPLRSKLSCIKRGRTAFVFYIDCVRYVLIFNEMIPK